MFRKFALAAGLSAMALSATLAPLPAAAKSGSRKAQERGTASIPHCARPLGTIALVEPENQWWLQYNLESPTAILKVFVQQSGCFTLVNRGRSLEKRAGERALADSGELQANSNLGKGQVRAADYFLEPNVVSTNRNSGGSNVGGLLGGIVGGTLGAAVGGISIKKKEANVTLSVVNARTTEEIVSEGAWRKSDVGFSLSAADFWGPGAAAAGLSSYQNTEIGQVVVLAYLDAYKKMVAQLGGLPANAAAAAPAAN